MKKLIFCGAFFALFSCNKTNQISENNAFIENIALKESSEAEITKLLAPKNNDTVYVTNFFATWCPYCMRGIPQYKAQMEALKNEKVKFTFVNLNNPSDWGTKVNDFAATSGLGNHIILFNPNNLSEEFFSKFQTWEDGSIPFTIIRKGNQTEETLGMLPEGDLAQKINAMLK